MHIHVMNQELKKSVFSEYRELSPKRLIFERIYEERYSESKHYSGDSKHYSSNSTSNSNYGTVLLVTIVTIVTSDYSN